MCIYIYTYIHYVGLDYVVNLLLIMGLGPGSIFEGGLTTNQKVVSAGGIWDVATNQKWVCLKKKGSGFSNIQWLRIMSHIKLVLLGYKNLVISKKYITHTITNKFG
jgi:hypothetical protein